MSDSPPPKRWLEQLAAWSTIGQFLFTVAVAFGGFVVGQHTAPGHTVTKTVSGPTKTVTRVVTVDGQPPPICADPALAEPHQAARLAGVTRRVTTGAENDDRSCYFCAGRVALPMTLAPT